MDTISRGLRIPSSLFLATPTAIIATLASALLASMHIAGVMFYGFPYPWLASILIGSRFYWHCSPFNGPVWGWHVEFDKLAFDILIWEAIMVTLGLMISWIRRH